MSNLFATTAAVVAAFATAPASTAAVAAAGVAFSCDLLDHPTDASYLLLSVPLYRHLTAVFTFIWFAVYLCVSNLRSLVSF